MYGKGGTDGKSASLNAVQCRAAILSRIRHSSSLATCLTRVALPLSTLIPATFQFVQDFKTNLI